MTSEDFWHWIRGLTIALLVSICFCIMLFLMSLTMGGKSSTQVDIEKTATIRAVSTALGDGSNLPVSTAIAATVRAKNIADGVQGTLTAQATKPQ